MGTYLYLYIYTYRYMYLSLHIYIQILAGMIEFFKVGRPLLESSPATTGGTGTRQAHWERFLAYWTEVVQPFPTRYNKYGNTCKKLDRVFCAVSFKYAVDYL